MNAREVALLSLQEIDNGAYANLVLKKLLEKCENDLDKKLTTSIVYGVLRHDLRLSFILEKFIDKNPNKIQKEIMSILKIGAYQYLFLDKIPPHSVVSESVNLAKKYANLGAAKFANAVLRALIRTPIKDKSTIDFTDMPHIEFSHPRWMFEMWEKDYGRDTALEIMKSNNEEGEITHRGNEIQGLSSQKAVDTLAPKSGDAVIDVCAAPGGKSLYMAEMMHNTGKIISCDIHEHRVELIRKNAERANLNIIEPMLWNSENVCEKWLDTADKVLVDAPCSGLGVIHKKPDIKWKKTPEEITELSRVQYEILNSSAKYLKVGGKMVYCTCTINKSENDNVTKKFLAENDNFTLISEEQIFPSKQYDGFYIALFTRTRA